MDVVGDEVWSPEGIKILGTPVGGEDFVRQACEARLDEEHKLWEGTRNTSCGKQSPGCPMFSVGGRFWFSAQDPDAITF